MKGEGPVVVTVAQSSHGGTTPVSTVEAPPLAVGGSVVRKGLAAVMVLLTQPSQAGLLASADGYWV